MIRQGPKQWCTNWHKSRAAGLRSLAKRAIERGRPEWARQFESKAAWHDWCVKNAPFLPFYRGLYQ